MKRQSSRLSMSFVVCILLTLTATLGSVPLTHAQFLPYPSLDYLFLVNLPAYYPPVSQLPIGSGLANPFQAINLQGYRTTNSGYYPDSTYYGAPAGTLPAAASQYIANTTGYYTIESVGCSCNL
ncbi:MAG: hypothetical protein ACMUIA_05720 [bacterium]